MSTLSPLLASGNWLYQCNLSKYHSAQSKRSLEQPNKNSFTVICVVAMISTVFCIVAALSILSPSKATHKSDTNEVSERLFDLHPASIKRIDVINMEVANQTSTQLPPHFRPLKAPIIKNNTSPADNMPNGNYSHEASVKETEFLLDRKFHRSLHSANNHLRKKNIHPYRRNVSGTTETITSFIHDQIPRPPHFKKMPPWKRQFDYNDNDEPRPFNFIPQNYGPQTFHKCNCSDDLPKALKAPINNIQDILNQPNKQLLGEDGTAGGVQITGKYRHPRGEGMRSMFKRIIKRRNNIAQASKLKIRYNRNPLNSYRPRSPGEINMLANREFKFMRPSGHWKYNVGRQSFQTSDEDSAENIYHQIIDTDRERQQDMQNKSRSANTTGKRKPFSLMLDIYPMGGKEQTQQTVAHQPHRANLRRPYIPLPPGPTFVNNLPYAQQLDTSSYNSIQFPQLQQQKYPQSTNYYGNSFSNYNQGVQVQSTNTIDNGAQNNPSQLMVHLNLYPKKKPTRLQRLLGDPNDEEESYSYLSNETIAKMDSERAKVGTRSGQDEPYQPLLTAETRLSPPVYRREPNISQHSVNIHAPIVTMERDPEEIVGHKANFKLPESMLQFYYTDAVVITPEPVKN